MFVDPITKAKADLQRYTKDSDPRKWGSAHLEIARMYSIQSGSTPGRNPAADKAIEHLEHLLEVLNPHDPNFVVQIEILVYLYSNKRASGRPADNLVKALEYAKVFIYTRID